MPRAKGVFCLEGAWYPNLKYNRSVRHMLELLSACEGARHIYKDCATMEELRFYLENWSQKRYRDYPILYLAFHGKPAILQVGKVHLSLDDVAALLEGKCARRIIHFGTCGTLDCHRRDIERFLKRTQAVAVCGFRGDIDWLKSTAFDLLMFEILQNYEISRRGMPAFYREVRRCYARLCTELGFRLEYLSNGQVRRAEPHAVNGNGRAHTNGNGRAHSNGNGNGKVPGVTLTTAGRLIQRPRATVFVPGTHRQLEPISTSARVQARSKRCRTSAASAAAPRARRHSARP